MLTVFKNSTVSRRSLMLQPSLADVSKLAPLPQLRQTCEILFGCKQTCQKLREFFVYKDAVGYKSDENSSRFLRDRVALRATLVSIHFRSPKHRLSGCYGRLSTALLGFHQNLFEDFTPTVRTLCRATPECNPSRSEAEWAVE